MSTFIEDKLICTSTPLEVYHLLDKEFSELEGGSTWLEWEPDTLLIQLPQLADPIAKDKVLAVHTVCYNFPAITQDWFAFEKVINAFCNNPCVADVVQVPSIEEVFYTITQLQLLNKIISNCAYTKDITFSNQVYGFIASVAFVEEWLVLPSIFRVTTQESLNSLNGIYTGNKKYQHLLPLLSKVQTVCAQLDTLKLEKDDLLKELTRLEAIDTYEFTHIKRIIGCFMYTPNG